MPSLASNRLRHVVRRVREAPLSVVATKARLVGRAYLWAPGCALRRAGLAPRGALPPLAPAFAAMGDALRAAVRETAAADPTYRAALDALAARVLDAGRFPCLGYGELPIPRGDDWRVDAVGGYAWPDRPFRFVNFLSHGADADVKVPWELSRLQWLVGLAETWAADQRDAERALAELQRTLADWDAANPLGYGPNWTVAMEVAIRAVNVGLAAAIAWPALDDATRARVRRMLAEHLRYIRAFPELSDHVGNHYLLNVTGLVFLEGVVFGGAARARLAARRWYADLAEQFEADGLHIEHAPTYHRLCVEAVLWTLAFADRAGLALPPDAPALAGRIWRALEALAMGNGRLPVLGDSDSGQVVCHGAPSRDLGYLGRLLGHAGGGAPLLCAAAADPSFLPGAGGRAEGLRAVGPFHALRRGRVDVVLRAGPHGLHGRASHDHDDNAAPWVTVGDADVLVEQGTWAYTRDVGARASDIASGAHNVVTVAGRLRFRPRPGSMSPTVADAPIATARASADALATAMAWSDAEAGAVRHARTVRLPAAADACLVVEDRVALERAAELWVYWHVAPGWTVSPIADGVGVRLVRDDGRASAAEAAEALELRVTAGEGSALALCCEAFRYSPHYGERASGTRVVVRVPGVAGCETTLTTVLRVLAADA